MELVIFIVACMLVFILCAKLSEDRDSKPLLIVGIVVGLIGLGCVFTLVELLIGKI